MQQRLKIKIFTQGASRTGEDFENVDEFTERVMKFTDNLCKSGKLNDTPLCMFLSDKYGRKEVLVQWREITDEEWLNMEFVLKVQNQKQAIIEDFIENRTNKALDDSNSRNLLNQGFDLCIATLINTPKEEKK